MNSNDENQDRELLERYRQASNAESLAPREAVRAAILEEARRVAATLSTPAAADPPRSRPSRWKMTAFATAATVLLAALVIAPKLLERERQGSAATAAIDSFKQAAVHKAQIEAAPAAAPVPVIPVQPAPPPKLEDIMPSPSIAIRPRSVEAPPPIHYPEQSVEINMLKQSQSLNQSRSFAAQASASQFTRQSQKPSSALLAAVSAGDLTKATQLLDQRAGVVDERDGTGRTPLMLAVDQGRLEMVRLLLDRGADPNATDQAGFTPLKLAQQQGWSEGAATLVQAGAR